MKYPSLFNLQGVGGMREACSGRGGIRKLESGRSEGNKKVKRFVKVRNA